MFTEDEVKELREIMHHFGEANQMKKLAEEASEFLEKYLKADFYGAAAEIADLKLLVDQFYVESIFVKQEYDRKKKRTQDRIKSKYYEV